MSKVYGKFQYVSQGPGGRPHWGIGAAPHIMAKLKRTFPRYDQTPRGHLILSATREIARDLEWFIGRYPLEAVDAETLATLKAQASAHRDSEEATLRILEGYETWEAGERQPEVTPREYQLVPPALLRANGYLLLGDDTGLGKTLAGTLIFCDPGALPALVVTPTHLAKQWKRELAKYYPWLTSHIISQGTPYDPSKRRDMKGKHPDILIVNYHKLGGWGDELAGKIQTLVCDEADELRTGPSTGSGGGGSRWYTAAQMIAAKAQYTLLATATPVHNYGNEIYNVVSVMDPDVLGTKEEFTREWGGKIIKDPRALGTYLRDQGIMLRRTRADVGRELPPVLPIEQAVETDHRKLEELIKGGITAMAEIVLDNSLAQTDRWSAAGRLEEAARRATGIAKAPYVARFVEMLLDQEEKVLLAGWHHDVYEIWLHMLEQYNPVRYTGTESPTQKDAAARRFIDGDSRVMLMSVRSGAGLNGLERVCSTVVFGEIDWSPAKHTQVIGRLNRDGQSRNVAAFFLRSESGADPAMFTVLDVKNRIAKPIVDPDAPLVEATPEAAMNRVKLLARSVLDRHGNLRTSPPPITPATPLVQGSLLTRDTLRDRLSA